MRKTLPIVWFTLSLMLGIFAVADTPPPGSVKAKVYDGTGTQAIGNVGDALKVNVTNSGGTSTVNQGNAGVQSWLVNVTNASIPVAQFGVWNVVVPHLNSGTDSVTVSGSITATNSANGPTGSAPPADATQIAGSDGTNLRALKTSSTGVLSVDASGSSVSVSNFPATQATNLTQIAGASPSVTNSLPARITNGTAFVDPTQIRSLTSISDSVTAVISGTPTVVANAGSGTFQTSRAWTLSSGTDSVAAAISNFPATTAVTQSTSPWVVSAASLPLPTGAATSALQTSGNASLTSIDSKTPALGQALAAASVPVVLTAAQLSTLTPLTSVAVTQGTSPWVTSRNWTLSSGTDSVAVTQSTSPWVVSGTVTANAGTNLNTSLLALDTSVNGVLRAQGSTTSGQSGPLVQGAVSSSAPTYTTAQTNPLSLTTAGALRTDASATIQPVSGSGNFTVVQPTGTNLHVVVDSAPTTTVTGTVTANQGGTWNINNISGTVSLPTGAATSANQTNGSEKTQIVDGAAAVVGPVTTISSVNYMPVTLAASGTTGSAVPSRTVQIGGSDGTNLRTLSTDTSGNLNVNTASSSGRTTVVLARNDYTSTNVTTAAYVQLVASTADTINQLYIFDSSGQTLFLAVGAAASEVNKAYIVPGGNGILNLTIPSGSRISVKAVSATASAGELSITFLK